METTHADYINASFLVVSIHQSQIEELVYHIVVQ